MSQSYTVLDSDGHVTESYQQIAKNQIVYASDFPHWDHSFPGSIDEIKERGDITDTQKCKILADNTRRLYGLKP